MVVGGFFLSSGFPERTLGTLKNFFLCISIENFIWFCQTNETANKISTLLCLIRAK